MKKIVILAFILVTVTLGLGTGSALGGGLSQTGCGIMGAHQNPSDPLYPAYKAMCFPLTGPGSTVP